MEIEAFLSERCRCRAMRPKWRIKGAPHFIRPKAIFAAKRLSPPLHLRTALPHDSGAGMDRPRRPAPCTLMPAFIQAEYFLADRGESAMASASSLLAIQKCSSITDSRFPATIGLGDTAVVDFCHGE